MEILRGRLKELPPERKATVRVFVSASGQDFIHERNALFREVFPKLREVCRQRSLDFSFSDLYWGVPEESEPLVQLSVSELRLKELRFCQKESLGPSVLVLIGNKFESPSVPAQLPASLFPLLLDLATEQSWRPEMLSSWFLKDKNSLPEQFRLQTPSYHYPLVDDVSMFRAERAIVDRERWARDRELLSAIVRRLSGLAELEGEARATLRRSQTDLEVQEAVRGGKSGVLCYRRNLEKVNIFDAPAARFINVKRTLEVDLEQQALLKRLKKEVLPACLPPENIWRTAVPWTRFGLDPGVIKHHLYLRGFAQSAEQQLKRLIEVESLVHNRFAVTGDSEFCEEVLLHLHRCRAFLDSFVGRDALMEEIRSRLERKWNTEEEREKDDKEVKEEEEEEKEEEKRDGISIFMSDDASEFEESFSAPKELSIEQQTLEEDLEDAFDQWQRDALSSPFPEGHRPLLLFGVSGSGKSALLAALFHRWLQRHPSSVRIVRFLHASPFVCSLRTLLLSLLKHLRLLFRIQLPHSSILSSAGENRLARIFSLTLKKLSSPVIFFLDGLEQLDSLDWLPQFLPVGVHLVGTFTGDPGGILVDAVKGPEWIEVGNLEDSDLRLMARRLLSRAKRRLTRLQFQWLLESVSRCPNPLYVQLQTHRTFGWRSYDPKEWFMSDEELQARHSADLTREATMAWDEGAETEKTNWKDATVKEHSEGENPSWKDDEIPQATVSTTKEIPSAPETMPAVPTSESVETLEVTAAASEKTPPATTVVSDDTPPQMTSESGEMLEGIVSTTEELPPATIQGSGEMTDAVLTTSEEMPPATTTESEAVPFVIVSTPEAMPPALIQESGETPDLILTASEEMPQATTTGSEEFPAVIVSTYVELPAATISDFGEMPDAVVTTSEEMLSAVISDSEDMPLTTIEVPEELPTQNPPISEEIPLAIASPSEDVLTRVSSHEMSPTTTPTFDRTSSAKSSKSEGRFSSRRTTPSPRERSARKPPKTPESRTERKESVALKEGEPVKKTPEELAAEAEAAAKAAKAALESSIMAYITAQARARRLEVQLALEPDLGSAIEGFFDRLEAKHGQLLVSKAVGYLCVSEQGLSVTELEDILSLDDDLLRSVFLSHSPPDPQMVRFPPRLSAGLLHDLYPHLVTRLSADARLLSWRNVVMATTAATRYASSHSVCQPLHDSLAEYFLGTWATIAKPLNLTEGLVFEECHRGVPSQGLRLPNSRRLNRRLLDELWRHLIGAERTEQALEQCLLNPDWLAGRCSTYSCGALVKDLSWAAKKLDAEAAAAVTELAQGLKLLRGVVECDGERLLEQLCGQLRSEPKSSPVMFAFLQRLKAHVQSSELPQLLPTQPCLVDESHFLRQRRRLRVVSHEGLCTAHPVAPFGSNSVVAVDLHRRSGCSLAVLPQKCDFADCEREILLSDTVTGIEATFPESNLVLVRTAQDRLQPHSTSSFDLVDLTTSRCLARSAFGILGRCLMAASDGPEWQLATYKLADPEVTIWSLNERPFVSQITLALPAGIQSLSRIFWSRSGQSLNAITESLSSLLIWSIADGTSSLPSLPFAICDVTRGPNDLLVLAGEGIAFLEPFTGDVTFPKDAEDQTLPVTALIGSGSGAYVLALCDSHPVRVWDLEEHQLVSELSEYRCEDLEWIGFFNEHRWLVVTCGKCENFATIWVFGSGAGKFYSEALRLRAIGSHDAPILGFSFSRPLDLAVSFGRDQSALFWSASRLQEDAFSRLFKAHQQRRRSHAPGKMAAKALEVTEPLSISTTGLVAFPKYKVLAVGRSNGCLSFYDLPALDPAPRKISKFYPYGLSELRAAGRWLAFKVGGIAAYVWDAKTLTEFHRFDLPDKEISGIALSANLLAISSAESPGLLRCFELPSGEVIEDIQLEVGIDKVKLSKDESFLAANVGNLPLLLPRASSRALSLPHDAFPSSSPCLCLLLSPDAQLLATGDAAGTIRVLAPFHPLLTSFRQAAAVSAATFVPPASSSGLPRLVTAGHRKLFVWAIAERRLERAIARHTGRPTLLAASPDGRVLASCGEDRQLVLWSTVTWGCLASYDLHCRINCLALHGGPAAIFAACDPRVADFTALAPNDRLGRLLASSGLSRPGTAVLFEEEEEQKVPDAPELFKTKAEAIAGTFSGGGRAAVSEVCCLL